MAASPCRSFLLFPVLLFYFSCVCCSALKLVGPPSPSERDRVNPIGSLLQQRPSIADPKYATVQPYPSPLLHQKISPDSCKNVGGLFLALVKSWARWFLPCICCCLCYFANFFPVTSLLIALFTDFQNKGFIFFLKSHSEMFLVSSIGIWEERV